MSKRQEAKRVRIDGQPKRRAKIVALIPPQPDIRDVLKAVFLPAERGRHICYTKNQKNRKNDKDYDTDEPKD